MHRLTRSILVICIAALALPAAAAASPRMIVGFQDDPTFRWNGNPAEALDRVQAAHASLIRITADWRAIAAKRPRHAARWNDPAYNFNDLDDVVRNAQQRGIQVLITIWGTPRWANGGKPPNVPPRHVRDLRNFAHAVADRYSGRHAGYPYVGYFSVWNEPNLGIFLSPQFDKKGRIVSPRIYAGLFKAARAGIKSASKTAQIAIGETSNMGRDHPKKGAPVSVAPGTFARLLARQKGLRFDAYATHPYSTRPNLPPSQRVRWPNVTLSQLKHFEKMLDVWFHRKDIPVWITEYGYQTKPAEPRGVSKRVQAKYLSRVMRKLRADPRVDMFVWFIFRDSKESRWKSGLVDRKGRTKPAYRTFSALANAIDGRTLTVKPGVKPKIQLPVPLIAYHTPAGSPVGVSYRVLQGRKLIGSASPELRLRVTQSVTFRAAFTPAAGKTYTLVMEANDANGNRMSETYTLVAPKPAKKTRGSKKA